MTATKEVDVAGKNKETQHCQLNFNLERKKLRSSSNCRGTTCNCNINSPLKINYHPQIKNSFTHHHPLSILPTARKHPSPLLLKNNELLLLFPLLSLENLKTARKHLTRTFQLGKFLNFLPLLIPPPITTTHHKNSPITQITFDIDNYCVNYQSGITLIHR